MERKNETTVRRVDTITCGVSLIVFGILFLLHMLMPAVSFLFIFRLWPCIFIMLGIELLVGNYKNTDSMIYDKGAVFLLVVLLLFAMAMGVMNEWMMHISSECIRW